jgi:hypothetical protein
MCKVDIAAANRWQRTSRYANQDASRWVSDLEIQRATRKERRVAIGYLYVEFPAIVLIAEGHGALMAACALGAIALAFKVLNRR